MSNLRELALYKWWYPYWFTNKNTI